MNIDLFEMSERIKNLRKKKGVGQKVVAMKLNITEGSYGKYEQGVNCPSNVNLKKLADYFEVSTDYILYGTLPEPDGVFAKLLKDFSEEEKEKLLEICINIIDFYKMGKKK